MAKQNGGIKVSVEAGQLVIRMPLAKQPQASASGKSLVIASTRGNLDTGVSYQGRPIILGVNAYSYNDRA